MDDGLPQQGDALFDTVGHRDVEDSEFHETFGLARLKRLGHFELFFRFGNAAESGEERAEQKARRKPQGHDAYASLQMSDTRLVIAAGELRLRLLPRFRQPALRPMTHGHLKSHQSTEGKYSDQQFIHRYYHFLHRRVRGALNLSAG